MSRQVRSARMESLRLLAAARRRLSPVRHPRRRPGGDGDDLAPVAPSPPLHPHPGGSEAAVG